MSQSQASDANANPDQGANIDAVRKEILAAQQAFEEDVKENGLYVSPEVKFRYAVALSKGANKEDFILARWCVFVCVWLLSCPCSRSTVVDVTSGMVEGDLHYVLDCVEH